MPDRTTGPIGDPPQVIARDPEAHRKLDGLTKSVQALLEWAQGDQMKGVSGMAAEHRQHAEQLTEHHDRLERHSKRLHALEQAGTDRMRWTMRTVAERGIGAGVAAAVGALAAIFASKPPHP